MNQSPKLSFTSWKDVIARIATITLKRNIYDVRAVTYESGATLAQIEEGNLKSLE